MSTEPPTLPAVSVVMPCKDGAATIEAQLAALAAQDYPGTLEVVVADNGSTDGSAEIAARWKGVRVVDASSARGPNHARNTGAGVAAGELILTCDADDVVDPGWVSAMVRGLRDFDLVGGTLDYALLNDPERRRPHPADPLGNRYGFLPTASGSCFGIRARVLADLGGWDEAFDGGPDDTELVWRAQLAGHRFGFAPDAVVHSRLRSTASALAKQGYDGGLRIPLLIRRFRPAGLPWGGLLRRVAVFTAYLAFVWPLALCSRRHRLEWIRRAALAAGFAAGLVRRPPTERRP